MRDLISIPVVQALHPKIRDIYRAAIEDAEGKFPSTTAIRIVQGGRTFTQQGAYYAVGRTVPGKDVTPDRPMGRTVTNSKPGQSFHQYFLAGDNAILYDLDGNGTYEKVSWDILKDQNEDGEADWMEMVDSFEAAGFVWGGRFHSIVDDPHFEMTFGHHWQDLLQLYNAGKFISGTKFVDI